MNIFWTAFCCITIFLLLFLFLILFLKLKISIYINNNIIKIFLWKIKVFDSSKEKKQKNKNEKNIDKDENFEKKYKGFKKVINFFRKLLDDKNDDLIFILKYIKKTFSIKKLDVSLDYGFGDAALTGITSGIIWGLISNSCSFVGRFIDINNFTNIAIKPQYTEKTLDYKVNFIFYIKILNLLKAYKHFKRFKKTLEGRD